jgi:hypothetical protein
VKRLEVGAAVQCCAEDSMCWTVARQSRVGMPALPDRIEGAQGGLVLQTHTQGSNIHDLLVTYLKCTSLVAIACPLTSVTGRRTVNASEGAFSNCT